MLVCSRDPLQSQLVLVLQSNHTYRRTLPTV